MAVCQQPCPTPFRMNTSLAVTCQRYAYSLLGSAATLVLRRLKSHARCLWGSLLWQGVICCHFDPHQLCIEKRGPPNLSVAFCCCLYVVVLGNLFRGGMPRMTVLPFELVSSPAAIGSVLGMAEKCVGVGALVERQVEWWTLEEFSSLVVLLQNFNNYPHFFLFFFFLLPERAQEELSGSWTHKSHGSENHASLARHDFN